MPARLSLRDVVLVLLVVTIWGFAFVAIRWGLAALPPFMLAALRFLFAAIPAVLVVARPPVPWSTLVAYGFAIGVFQFGLLFLGMQLGMPAGLSSVVIQAQVFFTIGLAAWRLHDRVDRHGLVGAAVAGAGIALLAWHKLATGAGASFVGFVLVLGAAFSWAVANVVAKRAARRPRPAGDDADRADDVDMLALVVWSSLAAPLPLAAASFAFEGGTRVWIGVLAMSWEPWACVLFLSYLATVFGFATWNALLHRYPTAVIAPFALLVPVVGLASGALFLGERLAPPQYAGAALVLAGLAYNVLAAPARAWLARSLG